MMRNWWFGGVVTVALLLGVMPATAAASGSPLGPPTLPTSAPFQQCPAVDLDSSCGYLIDITPSGSKVLVDPTTGHYDQYDDDVLVGVQNDSGVAVHSIHVGVAGSGSGSFAFDWDGLCNPGRPPVPAGCPFGPGNAGGYWGPDAQLTPDAGTTDSGTVTFPTPLAPGQYTYFSLDPLLAGSIVVTGNQNDVIRSQLSDGTKSGAHLIDPVPTAITDFALLAGPNAASAGGTVTYTVYSDPTCTHQVASGGTKPVTSGHANQSDAFGANLPPNATYYVQATYSGDPATNNTSAGTNCGDETVTFGTPPGTASASVTTRLVASNGASGEQLTVATKSPVRETATVTANGQPASGRVTYSIYSDSSCTTQVRRVNLGSAVSSNGVYPPSSAVELPNGTYYLQATYSGNTTVSAAKSLCSEVLTVGPPCKCMRLAAYVNHFHTVGTTRLDFNFDIEAICASGVGGCTGTIKVIAPGSLVPSGSGKAGNATTGVTANRSTAALTFTCGGPCARTTIYPAMTLQWGVFRAITVKVKRHGKVVKITRTIRDALLTPRGRAGKTLKITLVERCSSGVKTVVLKVKFDNHGAVDYQKSDLNGDGRPDRRQLANAGGFVRPTRPPRFA